MVFDIVRGLSVYVIVLYVLFAYVLEASKV